MCTVNWGDAVCTADRPLACTGRNVPMNWVLKVTSSVISTNRSGTARTAGAESAAGRGGSAGAAARAGGDANGLARTERSRVQRMGLRLLEALDERDAWPLGALTIDVALSHSVAKS